MAPPTSDTERFILPALSSKTRTWLTFDATYATSSGPSPCSTPAKTRMPRPISDRSCPPTWTRADETRWITARTVYRCGRLTTARESAEGAACPRAGPIRRDADVRPLLPEDSTACPGDVEARY